jgi:hypothetical protein
LSPTFDGFVSSFIPTNTAIVDSNFLSAGTRTITNAEQTLRTFFQFDLSGIDDLHVITSATLYLYTSANAIAYPYSLYSVDQDSAIHNSMTWNTMTAEITSPSLLDTQSVEAKSYGYNTGTLNNWDLLSSGNWEWATDLSDNTLSLLLRNDEPLAPDATREAAFYDSANVLEVLPDSFDPYLIIEHTAVPIPGALWLLGSGLIFIVGIRKKIKK